LTDAKAAAPAVGGFVSAPEFPEGVPGMVLDKARLFHGPDGAAFATVKDLNLSPLFFRFLEKSWLLEPEK
jgi:hypothetical protein